MRRRAELTQGASAARSEFGCGIDAAERAAVRPPEADLEPAAAVRELIAAGLVARVSSSEPLLVEGGREDELVDGLRVYVDGFVIARDPDGGVVVGCTSEGQTVRERRTASLRHGLRWLLEERGLAAPSAS